MPKRNLIWTIAIVAAAVLTVLLTRPAPRPNDPDQVRFRPVVRVYHTLREAAYRRPDDANLLRGAARGMAEALDEFSSYVPPERLPSFRARLNGYATCVGLLVDLAGSEAAVLGALPGSPAHEAGIEPGGRLIAVDGRDVADMPSEDIRQRLGAPRGRKVRLTILNGSGRQCLYELTAKRRPIETVTGLRRTASGRWEYYLDPDERIAYIRIKEFAPRTAARFRQSLRELLGARGLVLDLRDNPGGQLEAGYAVADLFLRRGVIFTRLSRDGRRETYRARPDGTHPDLPIVVLVNGQTASAAEIVAGALHLHDRAVLVGTRTRGKGLVQSMIPLPDDLGQVNLTTSEFLLGTDQPVARRPGSESWGVSPHVELPLSPAEQAARRRFWLQAAAALVPHRAATTAPATLPVRRRIPAVEADPQLACAMDLFAEPGRIESILARAAAERAAARRDRPASDAPQDDANADR